MLLAYAHNILPSVVLQRLSKDHDRNHAAEIHDILCQSDNHVQSTETQNFGEEDCIGILMSIGRMSAAKVKLPHEIHFLIKSYNSCWQAHVSRFSALRVEIRVIEIW
jgi:hypothetical protein